MSAYSVQGVISLLLLSLLLAACAHTPTTNSSPPVAAVTSDPGPWLTSWPDRQQTVSQMATQPPASLNDAQRLQLISWLSQDVDAARQHFATTQEGLGEDFFDYELQLIGVIIKLQDQRSLPSLIKVLDISNSIEQAVAEFGDAAVAPVIAATSDPDEGLFATKTLGFLLQGMVLKRNSLATKSIDLIQGSLLGSLSASDPDVRIAALTGLSYLQNPDAATTSAIRKVTTSDAYSFTSPKDGAQVFPVRAAANATLNAWGVK